MKPLIDSPSNIKQRIESRTGSQPKSRHTDMMREAEGPGDRKTRKRNTNCSAKTALRRRRRRLRNWNNRWASTTSINSRRDESPFAGFLHPSMAAASAVATSRLLCDSHALMRAFVHALTMVCGGLEGWGHGWSGTLFARDCDNRICGDARRRRLAADGLVWRI